MISLTNLRLRAASFQSLFPYFALLFGILSLGFSAIFVKWANQ